MIFFPWQKPSLWSQLISLGTSTLKVKLPNYSSNQCPNKFASEIELRHWYCWCFLCIIRTAIDLSSWPFLKLSILANFLIWNWFICLHAIIFYLINWFCTSSIKLSTMQVLLTNFNNMFLICWDLYDQYKCIIYVYSDILLQRVFCFVLF